MRAGAKGYALKAECTGRLLPQLVVQVAERGRVEAKLRQREDFFAQISEGVADLIAILDRDAGASASLVRELPNLAFALAGAFLTQRMR